MKWPYGWWTIWSADTKEEPGRNLTLSKPEEPKSPKKGKTNSDFAVQMVQAVQADPEDKEVEKLMFKEAIQQGHSSVDLAFMELDTDQDGKISRDEWVAKFGDDDEMVEMFDVYDADSSGAIDYMEFAAIFNKRPGEAEREMFGRGGQGQQQQQQQQQQR